MIRVMNLKPMPKASVPIYSEETVRIAVEFGLVLSEVAKKSKKEITGEITSRAEEVFLKEVAEQGTEKTAMNFVPLILAILEL